MNLIKEHRNDVVVLKLEGDVIGGPEAMHLNEEINNLLDSQSLKVVIDLENVQRMNSSGLGILINALHSFKQNSGLMKLSGVNPLVQNLMKITRLDNLFESYDTIDLAVSSF